MEREEARGPPETGIYTRLDSTGAHHPGDLSAVVAAPRGSDGLSRRWVRRVTASTRDALCLGPRARAAPGPTTSLSVRCFR